MQLRNKKTGEIRPAEAREDGIYLYDEITEQWYKYELDLLAKWWEYYEEPKHSYYLTAWGEVKEYSKEGFNINHKLEIGNYFETKEEAEKAVEKLKAITRLNKCGLRFEGYADRGRANGGDIVIYAHVDIPNNNLLEEAQPDMLKDLDLLFGGEDGHN